VNCRILQGSVFDRLPEIQAGSIDCAVTSPPYWMLRSYLPKDHPLKPLELGQEPTPQEYVANAVRWCGLVRDCLADHGTLWLNVGDSYTHDSRGGATGGKHLAWHGDPQASPGRSQQPLGPPPGNLALIPQRLAIALQDDDWLVRSVIVWHKPACMPCSVTGWQWRRCRVKTKPQPKGTQDSVANGGPRSRDMSNGKYIGAAEYSDCPGCKKCEKTDGYVLRRGSWRPTSSWEPVLMLAKTAGYFCDGDAVKTPPAPATVSRDQHTRVLDDPDEQFAVAHDHETVCDGANLRDVWTIPFEPLKEAHYAAFPSELVYRCLKAGTSQEGYCDRCGAPFVRVVEHTNSVIERSGWGEGAGNRTAPSGTQVERARTRPHARRAACPCPPPRPRPGRVLDPFCGSGRTGLVARRLGLDFVGVELNPDYAAMGTRILRNDNPLFTDFGEC
jgi:DNA modification methylase